MRCKVPAKGIGEIQKASQSVEIAVHSLLICVNKQLKASEEQVLFLKKTVAGVRQTIEDLEAAAPRPAESGRHYELCAVLHYG